MNPDCIEAFLLENRTSNGNVLKHVEGKTWHSAGRLRQSQMVLLALVVPLPHSLRLGRGNGDGLFSFH